MKNEDKKIFDRMKDVELLIIDDLGVEKLSDWLSDQFYQIIDHRWQNHKPMIITSNQSLDDLGAYYKTTGDLSNLGGAVNPSNSRRKTAESKLHYFNFLWQWYDWMAEINPGIGTWKSMESALTAWKRLDATTS